MHYSGQSKTSLCELTITCSRPTGRSRTGNLSTFIALSFPDRTEDGGGYLGRHGQVGTAGICMAILRVGQELTSRQVSTVPSWPRPVTVSVSASVTNFLTAEIIYISTTTVHGAEVIVHGMEVMTMWLRAGLPTFCQPFQVQMYKNTVHLP